MKRHKYTAPDTRLDWRDPDMPVLNFRLDAAAVQQLKEYLKNVEIGS